MTYKYNNVYIKDSYTIAGMYESDGPLKKYFDKCYTDDLYYGCPTFEQAESKLLIDNITNLLSKNKLKDIDINLIVSGDLQNQIASSDYAIRNFNIPFLGVYNACAISSEAMIIASTFIDGKKIKNAIICTSSHNTASEKQFRNPSEYGAPKKKYSTFTATGSASLLLTSSKTNIKIESSTIGRVMDLGVTDVNNMGAVMAPAAADTIYRHLTDLKREPSYYDLILTGDLGVYGKKILVEYLDKEYNIKLGNNYNDCGTMLYDIDTQPVFAGGSGPVCSALVNFGYILKQMTSGKLKKVLIVPTGAIFSPTWTNQKESIPSIAHAVSLEVI